MVKPHMGNVKADRPWRFYLLLADSTFAFACNSRNEPPWRRMRYHLHQARQARRSTGRDRARDIAQRAIRGFTIISVAAEGVRDRGVFAAIPAPSPARGCRWRIAAENKTSI